MFEVPEQPMAVGEIIVKAFELFAITVRRYLPVACLLGLVSQVQFFLEPVNPNILDTDLLRLYCFLMAKEVVAGWLYLIFFHHIFAIFQDKKTSLWQSFWALTRQFSRKTLIILSLYLLMVGAEFVFVLLLRLPKTPLIGSAMSCLLLLALLTKYIGVRLFMVLPLIATQPLSLLPAVHQSWLSTQGQFWRIIGVLVVPIFLIPIASLFFLAVASQISPWLGHLAAVIIIALGACFYVAFVMIMFADCYLRQLGDNVSP